MTTDVLTGLSQQIQSQYGVGETAKNINNVAVNGNNQNRSQLGDFNKYTNSNSQRKYYEQGYVRLDPFSVVPELFELLEQEPDATVLIKKRAFSSLAENYRPDMASAEDTLYLKATKILFQNKANQISAMEQLTKVARVSAAVGQLDDQLMPLIINLVDNAANNFANLSSPGSPLAPAFGPPSNVGGGDATSFQKLVNVINQIRQVFAYSSANQYTTWIPNLSNPFQSTLGQGTGVLELTNVSDISTTTTVDFNSPGSFSLTIQDPYGLMRVNESDIEWALSDSLNFVANMQLYQQGQASLQDIAANNIQQLNQARTARGVSTIQMVSNANAIVGNLVTAVIDNSGEQINYTYNPSAGLFKANSNSGVSISIESLIGGPIVGNNGLNPNEALLFTNAIISMYQALDYVQSAASTVFSDPSGKSQLDINYVRNKLRFHYANKLIAQPMDRVHIYLGSKSRTDNKLLSGISNMFAGAGFLQNLDMNNFSVADQLNTLFNPSNIDVQLEKSSFVGPDFPNGLWALMRNTFINDKNGSHVFAGLVTESSQSRKPGQYTVSVGGKDNSYFFDLGTVNLNPGVDNFVGPLYDPLTPYKTRFDVVSSNFKDQSPEFLDENKKLLNLQTYNKGLIKYKSGRYAGLPVTLNNFSQDSQITKDGIKRQVIHSPAGLVYKWKEGIGTFTYNADSYSSTDQERIGIPPITNDPFAGQDIMNTLSLLITGLPYNYATYFKAVSEFDNTARNPQTYQDPATSFYNSLTSTLQKNNSIWGDFIPFKSLVVDEASYTVMNAQLSIANNNNTVINNTLTQIQNLSNQIRLGQYAATNVNTGASLDLSSLKQQLISAQATLDTQINAAQQNLQMTIPLSNPAADTSYSASSSSNANPSDPTVRSETRRLTNFLTRRLSYMVRANEDKNLLIVDDSYDKDYDIINYEKSLQGSIKQFNSEYANIRSKISMVSSLLNLEVFCDTQGHIRIRPQQYNKVPSSIFYRMMQLQYLNGIQFFPKFLSDLYVDQISSLTNNLGVLELQIRLDGAYIGLSDDKALASYLNNQGNSGFKFFSDSSGNISSWGDILNGTNPDQQLANIPQGFIVQVQGQSQLSSVFNIVTRAKQTSKSIAQNMKFGMPQNKDIINQLISSIQQKSGQQVTLDNFITAVTYGGALNTSAPVTNIVKVNQDLADKINQRQQLIKTLSNALQNAQEVKTLNDNPKDNTNLLRAPNSYGNRHIPAVFQHMIEDETQDDYGPGSGARYIIHNYQVLEINISETPPDYTAIEVQGQLDPFIANNSLPFNDAGRAFPQGGNAIITAASIDYDLWKIYGFRAGPSIAAPFLSKPETQCAPYAVSLLSRARKEILQGTIRIAGNEFMQPGEVVFIEDLGLLFYIHSVNHSFGFGKQFVTSLTLKYGHNPGEYIPTPLDIIGKALYNNRDISGTINYRQTNVFNEVGAGAIIIRAPQTGTDSTSAPIDLLTGGNEGAQNLKVISYLLYSVINSITTNNASGSNTVANIELRIFYDKSAGPVYNVLNDVRTSLAGVLQGKIQVLTNSIATNNINKIGLPSANIIMADIDISDQSETRSPSSLACYQARTIINNNPGLASSTNPLNIAMFECVIDCVITFAISDASTGSSATQQPASNSQQAPASSSSATNSISQPTTRGTGLGGPTIG